MTTFYFLQRKCLSCIKRWFVVLIVNLKSFFEIHLHFQDKEICLFHAITNSQTLIRLGRTLPLAPIDILAKQLIVGDTVVIAKIFYQRQRFFINGNYRRIYIYTSITVPFVNTPSEVYNGDVGFFFTPMMGRWNVAFSSGCVTCALLYLNPWNMKRGDNK